MDNPQNHPATMDQEDPGNIDFFNYKTSDLLEAFGGGNHIPGSGSAAALTALIAIEMMRTVLQLSLKKESCKEYWNEFEFILKRINTEFKPRLQELFYLDSKEFHKVSFYRRKRDNAQEQRDKEYYSKASIDQLKVATEIPIEICDISFKLLDYAIPMFKRAYVAVQGDSGVSISNLLSAISGNLYVIFLNLKSFRKSEWKDLKMQKAISLAYKYSEMQKEAYSLVIEMYNKISNENPLQLSLNFDNN